MRILLVANAEIDPYLLRALCELNHIVETRASGDLTPDEEAHAPDCIILDLPSPSPELAAEAATAFPRAHQLQIVAIDDLTTRIAALRAGADACHARPIGVREIAGRLETFARRAERGHSRADFFLSTREQRMTLGGRAMQLTRREYVIVEVFAGRPGQALTAEDICAQISSGGDGPSAAGVRRSISRLTARVSRNLGWRLFQEGAGRAYRLEPRHVFPD